MSNYEDDDLDDELNNEEQAPAEEAGEPRPAGNRNFLVALGILGGLFVLVTIVLVLLYLNKPKSGSTSNISATNAAIQTANAQTAVAATLTSAARAAILPSDTPVPPSPTDTAIVAKATATSVLAVPTATSTGAATEPAKGLATPTANAQTQTQSVPQVLTQSARSTQTMQAGANLTATATALPKTGFAEDVGLPGLFGMALGLVLVIILVRRLRFSSSN
jgi:LPXTG-motif cell wall-anchored protein